MDRNARARIIWNAESLERRTKTKGKREGVLGQSGLQVLRALLFRFGDKPEPSYKAIRRVTGLAMDTISKALKGLQAAGICVIQRRSVLTRLGFRRITNLYTLQTPFPFTLIPDNGEPRDHLKNLRKKASQMVPFEQLGGKLREALDRLGEAIESASMA